MNKPAKEVEYAEIVFNLIKSVQNLITVMKKFDAEKDSGE